MKGRQTEDAQEATARRLYEALARGDRATLDAVLHPDFVGHATEGLPAGMGGPHIGPAAMRRGLWGRIAQLFDARAEVTELAPLADGRLLARGHYRGKARHSGAALNAAFTHVLTFADDGRLTALDQLTDSAAWVSALGDDFVDCTAPLETIDYSVADGVATICLNRPEVRNAIDQRVADDTLTAVRRAGGDPAVRAVLICGNGPALTVGGDIGYFGQFSPDEYGRVFERMTTPFHEAFRLLDRIEVPVVTAAHGLVVGGGLGYVCSADLVLAAEHTTFLTAFAGLALSGDGGGTWHLPRLIGARRAARMYLENTPVDAATALDWGLVNDVVPDDELRDRATALATKLAAGPTRAYGKMRGLLNDSWTNDLATQLHAETDTLTQIGVSADAQEAIDAFANKRQPRYTGR